MKMATGNLCVVLLATISLATTQLVLPRNMIGNEMTISEDVWRVLALQNHDVLVNSVHQSALQYLSLANLDLTVTVDGDPNTTVSPTTQPPNTTASPVVIPEIPLNYNVSETCVDDTLQMIADLAERKTYALKMFDAIGKLPAGIMEGNFQWIGASGECRNVTDVSMQGHSINGKYCQALYPLPGGGNPMLQFMQFGLCVPDTCNNLDVLALANTGLELLPIPGLKFAQVMCIEENPLSTGAIVMIVIIGILGTIMLIGTIYDVIITYMIRDTVDVLPFLPHTIQSGDVHDEPLIHNSPTTKQVEYRPGVFGECVLAFSVLTNGGKILDARHSTGTLAAIHGMRVLSMWWVILGHSYLLGFGFADNMLAYATDILPRFTFQAISNATFSVDTFFFLSGLLVTYLTLRELKEGRKVNWALFYFHRFWRLTPVYMFLIFFNTYLFPYLGTGPYAEVLREVPNTCEDYWWTNLLYINNFVPWPAPLQTSCYPVAWYLANDMQFHVISPIIIILLYKRPRIGHVLIAVLMAVCLATRIGLAVDKDLTSVFIPLGGNQTSFENNAATASDLYYTKPWTRISTYLVGMIVGYLLLETNCKIKINKIVNVVCWLAAWAIALAIVYGLYGTYHGHPLSRAVDVTYMTLSRVAWGVCIGWVSFACLTGNGGPVNTILSWKAWIPISRLTYCAYLTHFMVIMLYVMYQDRLLNLSDMTQIYIFIGSLVLSYLVSFIVSLMAEAPMLRLEKILLKKFK